MPWDEDIPSDLEHRLLDALKSYNWPAADTVCEEIRSAVQRQIDPIPAEHARLILKRLRTYRRFPMMVSLAEEFLRSGQQALQVRRQYAQALIDNGVLSAAERELQAIISDSKNSVVEEAEARGLTGRIYKQQYVNDFGKVVAERNQNNLRKAVKEYWTSYAADPVRNIWHGINVVALLQRALRDQFAVDGYPESTQLATEILKVIANTEEHSAKGLEAFDIATQVEALVALGRYAEAERTAKVYSDAPDADAFSVASTLRQFEEVWQLKNDSPPGESLLPILRAAVAHRLGGCVTISIQDAQNDNRKDLQKIFGNDRSVSLQWYLDGIRRAKAVCRIEDANHKGVGTGWLVKSTDFFPSQALRMLVITNHHVIPKALAADEAWANFQILGVRPKIKVALWTSQVADFDVTFCELEEQVDTDPIPISWKLVNFGNPAPRMYIIGHPGGRDVEFSIQDNQLLESNAKLLRYRTPTEPGSSGSPVFSQTGWQAVGLHHAGDGEMQALDGSGKTYKANEGIAILAILEALGN